MKAFLFSGELFCWITSFTLQLLTPVTSSDSHPCWKKLKLLWLAIWEIREKCHYEPFAALRAAKTFKSLLRLGGRLISFFKYAGISSLLTSSFRTIFRIMRVQYSCNEYTKNTQNIRVILSETWSNQTCLTQMMWSHLGRSHAHACTAGIRPPHTPQLQENKLH